MQEENQLELANQKRAIEINLVDGKLHVVSQLNKETMLQLLAIAIYEVTLAKSDNIIKSNTEKEKVES